MQSEKKIRAAIIGYGISGRLSHAYGLSANPEFEIAAVCDTSPERRAEAESELNCPTFPDHQSLLANVGDLDLACVITRSDTHCAIACDTMEAGIHTLITKPWALNSTEADILVAAQEKAGVHLFPWVPVYWSEEFRLVRRIIDSGRIGKVFMLRRQLSDFRRREDWQTEKRFGGGYLLNWGPHIVQPLVALVPSPVSRIQGHLQKTLNPGDADDAFISILEFENGCLALAEFAQAHDGLPSFLLQGDQGMIRSDGKTLTLIEKDPSQAEEPSISTYSIVGKPYGDEADIYRDIARTILRNEPYHATVEDALYNTRILDAIRASHESNQSVSLPVRSLS